MEKMFTKDEDIINEYYSLVYELGTTQTCCDAVLDLSKKKSEPWKSILEGLIHTLKGDGIEIASPKYDNIEEYEKASDIFNKIKKQIKDKKGLLFLFVEKERISALALSFKVPMKQIETLYDNLINKFKEDKTPSIQAEIAKAMLNKSFMFWKYSKLAKDNKYDEEYKNLFKKSMDEADKITSTFDTPEYRDNAEIQITIAKSTRNWASDKVIQSDEYKEESLQKQEEIIRKYIKNDRNTGLKIQVSKAMFQIAMNLHVKKDLQDSNERCGSFYSIKKIEFNEVLEKYDNLIKNFKDTKIYDIQQDILLAMLQKAVLYRQEMELSNLLDLYNEIISAFKDKKDSFFKFNVADTMIKKIALLYEKTQFENALKQWNEFEEWSKNVPKEIAFIKEISVFIGIKKEDIISKLEIQRKDEKTKKQEEEKVKQIEERIKQIEEKRAALIKFYPDNERHLEQLIELINKNQIIPFIGAGLSHFEVGEKYAFPLWGEFLDGVFDKYEYFQENDPRKRLKDGVKPEFKGRNSIEKASFLKNELGQAFFSVEVGNIFAHKKSVDMKPYLKKQPHILIPEIFRNRIILTTNFDNLIELAYEIADQTLSPCSVSDINKMDDINRNNTILYKLHGTIDQPNSIILTQEDYNEHYKPYGDHSKILNKYLVGNSILFMGCSLEGDEDLMLFYNKSLNYAIFPCTEEGREEAEKKLSKKNIIPILFEKEKFHFIVDILKYCLYRKEKEKEKGDKSTFYSQSVSFDQKQDDSDSFWSTDNTKTLEDTTVAKKYVFKNIF